MNTCLNCNQPLLNEPHFCPDCGQKTALKRLNLHDIWHDMVHYFTHADKGIFQLLKALITKTGTVAREFVAGKRKKYFPPLNFFLIAAAIYLFMNSQFAVAKSAKDVSQSASNYSVQKAPTAAVVAYQQKMGAVRNFFVKYANFVAMFAAPFISLLVWLFYKKGRYNYTEHLVANLYLIGFTNLVRCLIYMPLVRLLDIDVELRSVSMGFMAFEILYRTIFYYHFMGEFTNKGWVKALGLSVLTAITWWLLISGFIFVYMILG